MGREVVCPLASRFFAVFADDSPAPCDLGLRISAGPTNPPRVTLLDLSLPTPAENLALDEALLDACDAGGKESLRFWESPERFVVVGYGNRIASEVDVPACKAAGVPILRRCSGGGTVVQGPGCLNYNIVLRIPEEGPLTTVTGTNRFVMERMRDALQPIVAAELVVEGHTDLAMRTAAGLRKFSGNAQRRRRSALIFHGTLLLSFELGSIAELLAHPTAEPGYRERRSHLDFVANLDVKHDVVKHAVAEAWRAAEPLPDLPDVAALVAKHRSEEWNRYQG